MIRKLLSPFRSFTGFQKLVIGCLTLAVVSVCFVTFSLILVDYEPDAEATSQAMTLEEEPAQEWTSTPPPEPTATIAPFSSATLQPTTALIPLTPTPEPDYELRNPFNDGIQMFDRAADDAVPIALLPQGQMCYDLGDVWHHPDVKDLYMVYLECNSTRGWVNAKWVVGACLVLSDLDCQDWMLP